MEKGLRKSKVTEYFFILVWVMVIGLHTYVKINCAMHLRFGQFYGVTYITFKTKSIGNVLENPGAAGPFSLGRYTHALREFSFTVPWVNY